MSDNKEAVIPKVRITATVFHVDQNASFYKVKFRDLERKVRTILIGREIFRNPSKVVDVLLQAHAAMPDEPGAAIALVKQAEAERDQDKTITETARAGWHGDSFVYLGETFGSQAATLKHDGGSQVDPALGLQAGSAKAWKKGLSRPCKYSDFLVFAASVPCGAPLLDLLSEDEGAIFHFQPMNAKPSSGETRTQSSSGKTSAARVGASLSGRCRKTDLISFAMTERGLEELCFCHNNMGLSLDEEGRALAGGGKHVSIEQLPYKLTSGRGTQRSKTAAHLRNLTWLLFTISTGERLLGNSRGQSSRSEGTEVRMPAIPVPSGAVGGIFNLLNGSPETITKRAHILARETETTITQNYGVVMPKYLRPLVEQRTELTVRARRIVDNFVDRVGADGNPWERRFATKFGIVLAGAIFLSEFGFAPWTKKRAFRAIRSIYWLARTASASVKGATDRTIASLKDALSANRFPLLGKGETLDPKQAGQSLGVTRKSAKHGLAIMITQSQLKQLVVPTAIYLAVRDELASRGVLIKAADGEWTRETMIQGLNGSKRRRYIMLGIGALLR